MKKTSKKRKKIMKLKLSSSELGWQMSVATEREKKMAEMLDASIPRMMRSLSAMAPPRLPPCSQVPDED